MKVAVTGHTSGIGKAVYDLLSTKYECAGFSRSNGYDIRDLSTVEYIRDYDPDVFVNNCMVMQYRTLLLLHNKWKHLDKTVINVGSYITELNPPPPQKIEYYLDKLELENLSYRIMNERCRMKSLMLRPGTVDTEGTRNLIKEGVVLNKNDKTWMDPSYIAHLIDTMISCPYRIKDISICNFA